MCVPQAADLCFHERAANILLLNLLLELYYHREGRAAWGEAASGAKITLSALGTTDLGFRRE